MKEITLFIKNIKKYYHYAYREAKAELKSEVADSYLNWIWWILNPLAFMMIYSLVFGYIFKSKEEYFIAFVLIGVTTWDLFSRMMKVSVTLITAKRGLITKAYIPKYILLLSKSFVYLFKFFISLALLFIIMIILRIPFTFKMLYFIPNLCVFYLICFGLGLILMHFGVFLQDLSNAINILLKLVFYISGVFYNIHLRITNKLVQYILLRANPVAFFMNEFRNVMIYAVNPNFKGVVVWLMIGIVLCTVGIYLIHKNENTYAKVI